MGGRTCASFFYRERDESKNPVRGQQGEDSGSGEIDGIISWYTGLTGIESVCWGFNTVPSDVERIYWQNTDEDIRTKINLKLGMERAKSLENLQSLSLVVSSALGGGKRKPRQPQSGAEAAAMFNNVMGTKTAPTALITHDPFTGLDNVFEKLT